MKIYCVGGAVRDELLGLPIQDRDYVVVGSTPEEMTRLNYKPVGKDFPVFLHPETHEEYALARTERKIAKGYKGFQIFTSPDVTLEQDLIRRDLTINAIAKDAQGILIDPFGGQKDLQNKILRHISPAFSEDPVRILRLARFAARFNFNVAEETMQLMREMVTNGEVDALIAERVWQELASGLMEEKPSHMFKILRECGALKIILPEIDQIFDLPQSSSDPEIDSGLRLMWILDYAATQKFVLPVRFAALTYDLGKNLLLSVELIKKIGQRLKVPNSCNDLAILAARYHSVIHAALPLSTVELIDFFQATDAYRKPQRFTHLLEVCLCDFHGKAGDTNQPYSQADYLIKILKAATAVKAATIAETTQNVEEIRAKLGQARIAAIEKSKLD